MTYSVTRRGAAHLDVQRAHRCGFSKDHAAVHRRLLAYGGDAGLKQTVKASAANDATGIQLGVQWEVPDCMPQLRLAQSACRTCGKHACHLLK